MKLKKKYPSESRMRELAAATSLTYDGGDDNRLFAETIFTRSKDFDKAEYNKMEADIADYEIAGTGFLVSAWNDCSGYSYWTVKQEEDNYIQVTVYIKDASKVKADELKKAVERAVCYFNKYARYY